MHAYIYQNIAKETTLKSLIYYYSYITTIFIMEYTARPVTFFPLQP